MKTLELRNLMVQCLVMILIPPLTHCIAASLCNFVCHRRVWHQSWLSSCRLTDWYFCESAQITKLWTTVCWNAWWRSVHMCLGQHSWLFTWNSEKFTSLATMYDAGPLDVVDVVGHFDHNACNTVCFYINCLRYINWIFQNNSLLVEINRN